MMQMCDSESKQATDESDQEDSHEENGQPEAELATARSELEDAKHAVLKAEEALEIAQQELLRIQEAIDSLGHLAEELQKKEEELGQRDHARAELQQLVEEHQAQLQVYYEALERYLNEVPGARQAQEWLQGPMPQEGRGAIMPDNLVKHFRGLAGDNLKEVCRYIHETEPAIHTLVEQYADRLHDARSHVDKAAVMIQASRYLSGTMGEQLVVKALSPLCESIDTQARTFFENGRYTKTDLILHGLKCPIVMGKGEHMGAPAGGSIALEIKNGSPNYLWQQKDHMVFQAAGHSNCDAHATLCSRDIHDLPEDKEKTLREELRKAGSPLIACLPGKEQLDQAVWNLIHMRKEEKYGK